MPNKPLAVVSIGGNVIIKRDERGAIEEQFENTIASVRHLAVLLERGYSVIITHGNGPIVGNIVLRNEVTRDTIPPMPIYMCDADSEGGIGFMIQQSLYNELHRVERKEDVIAVVTQVVVDENDPAFSNPTKPIGPFYTKEEAESLAKERGWTVMEDSQRGYRRVVPSPRPIRIVEAGVVKRLAEMGIVVIAVGGGGVPVLELPDGSLKGVDAVIDKDLATSTLAGEIGVELFINLTQVEMVYLDFGKTDQRGIKEMDVEDARRYMEEGHFAPGSMGPKIEAAIDFIEGGGKDVIITSPELIEEAMEGKAGTRIKNK
jgi:carbamate kinase